SAWVTDGVASAICGLAGGGGEPPLSSLLIVPVLVTVDPSVVPTGLNSVTWNCSLFSPVVSPATRTVMAAVLLEPWKVSTPLGVQPPAKSWLSAGLAPTPVTFQATVPRCQKLSERVTVKVKSMKPELPSAWVTGPEIETVSGL